MLKEAVRDNREGMRRLIEYIRRENFTPGDRLPSIRQLAATLGLGTTVVRDALLQAQTTGLVKVHPRAGAFVQSLDFAPLVDTLMASLETALLQEKHNLFHLMEARRLIEMEVVGQAASRRCPEDLFPLKQALEAMDRSGKDRAAFIKADEQFHLGIARIAGNPVLLTVLRGLLVLLRPYRMTLLPGKGMAQTTRRRHREIYQSLQDGDPEASRAVMGAHLTEHSQRFLDQLKNVPAAS